MKHKHYDMIVAKAANMDLVCFEKQVTASTASNDKFSELWCDGNRGLCFHERNEYFLCLPQHKDSVLAGLNGANLEYLDEDDLDEGGDGWYSAFVNKWSETHWCMTDPNIQIRIKPRKEKRWIAVNTKNIEHLGGLRKVNICSHAFLDKAQAEEYLNLGDSQLIEIEVDV